MTRTAPPRHPFPDRSSPDPTSPDRTIAETASAETAAGDPVELGVEVTETEAGPVPKYYVVKQHLLRMIKQLPPGSAVPPERVLTAELGTSRTTVRQALSELVGEGRLVRRQGSGTFVAEPKVTWPLSMTSFTEQAAANGMTAGTTVLSAVVVQPDEVTAERLDLGEGEEVIRIERLRTADAIPMAVEVAHLPAARFPGLAETMADAPSLYAVLDRDYGVTPFAAAETIETAAASPREAQLLQTDVGAPMLVLSRHSHGDDERPVEWVRSWYRGDRYVFVARLAR